MSAMNAIPDTMRAAAIDRNGAPEEMHEESMPVPHPGANEILIEVDVAGVGEWDPALVAGELDDGGRKGFPRVFGSEGAGTVVAVGSRVKRYKVGDRVYGWGFGNKKGGFFAEYVAIPGKRAAPIPDTLSPEEAGALAVSGITALQGLEAVEAGQGNTLLVVGASGGVGHVAIQLAKRMGARVLAVASNADGVDLAKKVGADGAVDGRSGDVLDAARRFSPEGYDAAVVFAGGGFADLLGLVKKGGRVAYPHGVDPRPDVRKGVKLKAYDGECSPGAFERLNELVGAGQFHVELSHVYALGEAASALRDVQGHHLGKLAVKPH